MNVLKSGAICLKSHSTTRLLRVISYVFFTCALSACVCTQIMCTLVVNIHVSLMSILIYTAVETRYRSAPVLRDIYDYKTKI